jgi:hypothetical protein
MPISDFEIAQKVFRRKLICPICKKESETFHKTQVYCVGECQAKAKKQRQLRQNAAAKRKRAREAARMIINANVEFDHPGRAQI